MLKTVLANLKEIYRLTNKEIALRSGISESTVCRILNGKIDNPSMHELIGLSRCFNIPIDTLTENCNDRILRIDEFPLMMVYRTLPENYKEKAKANLSDIAAEWYDSVGRSYNVVERKKYHRMVDRMSMCDLKQASDIIKNELPHLIDKSIAEK